MKLILANPVDFVHHKHVQYIAPGLLLTTYIEAPPVKVDEGAFPDHYADEQQIWAEYRCQPLQR